MIVRSFALTSHPERVAGPVMGVSRAIMLLLIVLVVAQLQGGRNRSASWLGYGSRGDDGRGLAVGQRYWRIRSARLHRAGRRLLQTRFPGLGLLIASLNFPNVKPMPVVVAYLLHFQFDSAALSALAQDSTRTTTGCPRVVRHADCGRPHGYQRSLLFYRRRRKPYYCGIKYSTRQRRHTTTALLSLAPAQICRASAASPGKRQRLSA